MLRALLIAIAAATLLAPTTVAGQALHVDQKTGRWMYAPAGAAKGHELTGGETIRMDAGDSLHVRVVNTNSALYTCSLEQPEAKVPELEALRSALGTFGPYLTGVATLSRSFDMGQRARVSRRRADGLEPPGTDSAPEPSDEAEEAREAASSALEAVDAFLFGSSGLNATRLSVLGALAEMRTAEGDEITAIAERIQSSACTAGCGSQTLARQSVDLLDRAARAHHGLQRYLGELGDTDAPALDEALSKLQGDAEALVATAYRTEHLVRLVADAKPEISCGSVGVRRGSGRALSIAVASRGLAEMERVATLPPRRIKVEAQPRLRPRPAIGVALVYAPEARYDVPGTKSQVGGGTQITSASTQDARFTYGVTLSLILTDRLGPVQLPFTLGPEIVANPSSDTRAIGLGVGGTIFGGVKWGSGYLWTRHRVLRDGQEYGDVLPFADHLRTRETYGNGRFYVSASLTGWPLIKL
jgi:hypothetical protein